MNLVMLRFREGRIGVLADIRKAFQMIEIQEQDQDYLRFLWWEDQAINKIKIFKHKRVVFGVKCSPFILGAVIDQHLKGVKNDDLEMAQKLRKCLYVDNCVTSVDSMQEYVYFKTKAVKILAEAKMELRQWEHSTVESPGIGLIQGVGLGGDSQGNDDFSLAHSELPQLTLNQDKDDNSSFVLGMKWNKDRDTLSCVNIPEMPIELTKRNMLAAVSMIFDPMGILSPAMVYPKILLQTAWIRKIGWDEKLSNEIEICFKKWVDELHYLKQVEIPRNMKGESYSREKSGEQLHIFCDASQVAYAAIVFLRVQNEDRVSVQLLQAKARVAPVKKMTIPRLEVLGCVTGARLGHSIQDVLGNQRSCFYWSDSTTALAWIKRNDEWGTFVGNRVREILKLSEAENWRHIPGKYNPADLPSRGCSSKQLLKSLWWEGPSWLKQHPSQWPNEKVNADEEIINSEKKKTVSIEGVLNNIPTISEEPWYAKKSSYFLCLQQVAWLRRFINNCLDKKKGLVRHRVRHNRYLSMEEINEAEENVVKMIQIEVFPANSNYIGGLRVSKDKESGLYHVVTKLLYRQDSGRFKKPLLLPCEHPVVEKLIREEHLKYGHAGVQFLVNKLREKFWIIHTKKAVRKVVHKCTICIRYTKKAPTVPTSPLPENRVKDAKVFEVTGIDLAGPLYLRNNDKVWIVIFTCAIIRAVHLELVEKIDTKQFLLALGRFIYRRGRISIIYTDNGTNFQGTAKAFAKLNWNKICEETKIHRIKWIFNPPAAPWWGGFWERLVRTLKEYLRKILGHNKLTKVELETSICFVESLINGRPLTYVSEDPDDLIPLTPAAFIQDIQGSEYPEIEELNGKKLREKLRHLTQVKQELRDRFRSEYLGQLVQRVKPADNQKFELGEVVLIASENMKRLEWPMARITELIPGTDGEIRVAKLKTSKGELIRPLKRLIPLEIKSTANHLPVDGEVKLRAKSEQLKEREEEDAINLTRIKKIKSNEVTKALAEINEAEVRTRSGRRVQKPTRFRFS